MEEKNYKHWYLAIGSFLAGAGFVIAVVAIAMYFGTMA
jgi:uncharacterized BrkB/YihY/UPF0761 family membrane protein